MQQVSHVWAQMSYLPGFSLETFLILCFTESGHLFHSYVAYFLIVSQIADIMAATELEQPSMAGYDVAQGRWWWWWSRSIDRDTLSWPRKNIIPLIATLFLRTILGEYLARVKSALNPHYDEVSATVFKMRDKYLQNIYIFLITGSGWYLKIHFIQCFRIFKEAF